MANNSDTKKNKNKSIRKQTRDKYWQIRVKAFLDARLEDYMKRKGIVNKSEFIRNMVIMYLDLTDDEEHNKIQQWRDLVEEITTH